MSKEAVEINGNIPTRIVSVIRGLKESLGYLRERRVVVIVSLETAPVPVLYTNFPTKSVVPKDCEHISVGGHILSLVAVAKDGNISWLKPNKDGRTIDIGRDEDLHSLKPRTIIVSDGRLFHNLAGLNGSLEINRSALAIYFKKLIEDYGQPEDG